MLQILANSFLTASRGPAEPKPWERRIAPQSKRIARTDMREGDLR